MNVPCVRVPRETGEATRQRLADAGLLDHEHQITVVEGHLYIPVVAVGAVPADFEVVEYESPARDTQTTPAEILGYEPSYERLGDIVILDEDDPERAREIAEAIVESDLKADTVVNRASKIKGELRVRDWDVLVGDSTETVHREYGTELHLDIDTVYFSPRLATERHRVVEQIREGEHVFDMFAGVGPFAVPAAEAGAEVVACDLNEAAIEFLRENAKRNDVADRITAVHGDVREIADDYEGWAERLIMNLPHSADEFLDTAVRLAGDECVVHLYDIQHEDDPFGPGLAAVRAAAEPEYDVEVLEEQIVRSYAPHEFNVCLDVRLTKRS
ncbi:methyltransferase domain-containing protein [Haloferax sp. MBLA0076]|uniref:Methyltransferase domain-containing protein n=1 Tax=Haloferax litoreum TaxID=2666140 RepID=A0A6A8GBP6_9EURY|nr:MULTISPECIES: class I SAM-dependent methyltransferase family protein [Haloferax]KAB1192013.1 class I SAM-dependent methyltransferase family protein [Haloferax sp. CBA1148]MRX20455.1 methyltransferase domain-containing protein [Haloferax litoreum]